MLILTRQRHQSVMIGPDVKVEVVEIQRDKVRLGFHAPQSIKILREEIARENRLAAQLTPGDIRETSPAKVERSQRKRNHTMDPFLRAAIDEAKLGLSEGGLPIGSVLVRGNQIVARGHNRRVQHGDPTAHGEIDCLRNAGRQASYKGTVIYSTLMPCHMCAGAIVQFGVGKVIAGENRTFPSARDFMVTKGVEVVDLDLDECFELLQRFARENPRVWDEDIGVD